MKQYLKAAKLAINLKQPKQLLEIVKTMLRSLQHTRAITHKEYISLLTPLAHKLTQEEIKQALPYIRDWNTSPRNCCCAQALLGAILATQHPQVIHPLSGK